MPEPRGRQARFLGDVDLLDNGNVLVSWSDLAHIGEFTPTGDEVWAVDLTGEGNAPRLWSFTDLYDLWGDRDAL